MEKIQRIERSIIKKYRQPIWNRFIGALKDYRLVEAGDRIAVCVSGGKDSALLAKCMQLLQRYSDVPFEVVYITMDAGHTPEVMGQMAANAALLQLPVQVFETDVFRVVSRQTGGSPCYLCARMRRGWLYKQAQALGCNKMALGHHFDDVVETTLMNMLYGAEIKTMLPRVPSDNYEGMQLIRPLYQVHEADIQAWVRYNELSFVHCACPLAEKAACGDSKRQEMKQLVAALKQQNPQADQNIFRSLHNVNLGMVVGVRQADGQPIQYFWEKEAK